MAWFLRKLLFRVVKQVILAGWFSAPIKRLKIGAVSAYLRLVDGVRKGVLGVVAILLMLMLLIVGFVAVHVGLFIVLDWEIKTIGIVTLCLGGVYFLVPLIVIMVGTSERTWMKISGGNELVRRVTEPKQKQKQEQTKTT